MDLGRPEGASGLSRLSDLLPGEQVYGCISRVSTSKRNTDISEYFNTWACGPARLRLAFEAGGGPTRTFSAALNDRLELPTPGPVICSHVFTNLGHHHR
jgi:hypothetical protein